MPSFIPAFSLPQPAWQPFHASWIHLFQWETQSKAASICFYPGDHFIECVQIFTLETRSIAETCEKDLNALTWPCSYLRKLVPRHPLTPLVKWKDEGQWRWKRLATVGGRPCQELANLVAAQHLGLVLETGPLPTDNLPHSKTCVECCATTKLASFWHGVSPTITSLFNLPCPPCLTWLNVSMGTRVQWTSTEWR